MALSTNNLSLLDVARRLDPDGKPAVIAEVMAHYNEILDDIPFIEGNTETGNKTTIRGSLPTPAFRLINQGIVPGKSTTKQVMETCGIMEAYSEVDVDLAKMARDISAFRFQEDKGYIEAMSQLMASTLIYGDTSVNPDRFVGLAPRYYSFTNTVSTYNQLIDAQGSGSDNTSIWLVGWNSDTCHGIYPKGSMAGLVQQDLGEETIYDANLGRYQAFRAHFQWKCGLCVRDYRFVVRICNIDISDLETAGDTSDTSANIIKYMSMALDKIPPSGSSRLVFYCNQRVRSMLRVKMLSRSNTWVTLDNLQGPGGITRPTLQFMGYPVRRIDEITNTEAHIT